MKHACSELTYCNALPKSFMARAILKAREKIFHILSKEILFDSSMSVLDVGVSADRECAFSNYFESLYPYPGRITALSDQDASWMEKQWPGLRFVHGNALNMPFEDGEFDLVFSSAVIEHVGSREQQHRFLEELIRVSRKHVFITTPNRWFPLEMHSGIPFIHWLSPRIFRAILRVLGMRELSQERNLNLLSRRDLGRLCESLPFVRQQRIHSMWFAGLPSNLLLHLEVQQ